jgi:hypothetical protein
MRRWGQFLSAFALVLAGLVVQPAVSVGSPPTPAPVAPIYAFDWTHVNSCNANTSYYSNSQYRTAMRAGVQWDTTCKWRTLMKFDLSRLAGAQIIDARFQVTADHTGACAGADIELWRSEENLSFPSLTWNGASGYWYNYIDQKHFTAHEGSPCAYGDAPAVFDEGGQFLENEIRRYLANGWTTMALGLRGNSESDHFDWTKFRPDSPLLQVTYNHAPTAPTGLRIASGCGYSCDTSGAMVSSGTPTLQAVAGDPNGGTLARIEFEVDDRAHTVALAASGQVVSEADVGVARSWPVTPALGAGAYSWRVRGCDTVVCGDYSGWFDFTVDLDPPGTPAVSSAAYPGTWSGGVGVPGLFTISVTGASSFDLLLNELNQGTVDATTGSSWTVSLTPDRGGPNTVAVRARDRAGNMSSGTYTFLVTQPASSSWAWELNEGAGTSAESAPAGLGLRSAGTAAWTAGRLGGGALSLDGASYWTGPPVVDTSRSFTVTARVRRGGSTAGPMTAVSQDGAGGSGFRLQYRTDLDVDPETPGTDPAWCFTMFAADGGAETAACSTEQTGSAWVHLAGVYDQVNHTIRIYVDGANFDGADRAAFAGSWSAVNGWVVGGAKAGGGRAELWSGAVDRVAGYLKVLNQSEIATDKAQS